MPEALVSGRRAAALPPDERRAAIVAATEPLVLEHGEGVTTKQIAAAAGVAEGTIFRVFADKDALLAAVVEQVLDTEPFETALAAISPDLDFEARLVVAADIVVRRVLHVWRLLSNLGPRLRQEASRPLADSPALTAIFATDRSQLRVEPAQAARMLRALALSLTHPLLSPEPTPAEEIVRILLHGIEARP